MKRLAVLTICAVFFLVLLIRSPQAPSGYMTLLAVAEKDGALLEGSIADLSLTIQPGSGRVFIDTQPASKLDTQMSTRLAKNIACRLVQASCSKYDFFYTITSGSIIIGGPSASSSVAILTAAVLSGVPVRQDVAFTGTITSGNIIGSVAGISKKIDAAAQANITTVLIPAGSRFMPAENHTVQFSSPLLLPFQQVVDLVAYGRQKGVTVIEIGTLEEAFEHMTGISLPQSPDEFTINPTYQETMRTLGLALCERSVGIRALIEKRLIELNNTTPLDEIEEQYQHALNLTAKGQQAYNRGDSYSAASFCFGASVEYRGLLYKLQQLSPSEIKELFSRFAGDIISLNGKVNAYPIKTITDLQAYMIVKERLIEANDRLIEFSKQPPISIDQDAGELGLVAERTYSALAWSAFFGTPGRKFELDNETLRISCDRKLSETLEFYQYANLLYPDALGEAKRQIEKATGFQHSGNYALCLFKAATAKAQINVLLSTTALKQEDVDALVGKKILAARQTIAQQQAAGIFPVLGYSYVEYAQSLREELPLSALLYAEYALELSNLEDYLSPVPDSRFSIRKNVLPLFVAGIMVGLLAAELYHLISSAWKKKSVRKRIPKKRVI